MPTQGQSSHLGKDLPVADGFSRKQTGHPKCWKDNIYGLTATCENFSSGEIREGHCSNQQLQQLACTVLPAWTRVCIPEHLNIQNFEQEGVHLLRIMRCPAVQSFISEDMGMDLRKSQNAMLAGRLRVRSTPTTVTGILKIVSQFI